MEIYVLHPTYGFSYKVCHIYCTGKRQLNT
jgi:hypothetical protein